MEAFWADIENRFLQLHHEQKSIKQNGFLYALNHDGNAWTIGGSTDNAKKRFEWVVEQAALRLGLPADEDPVRFWLNRLKKESPHFKLLEGSSSRRRSELDSDEMCSLEMEISHSEGGVIELLCKASEEYCVKCDTEEKIKREAQAPLSGSINRSIDSSLPDLPPTKIDPENRFIRQGEIWTISYDDESVQLPHLVGLEYIALLLQNPRKEIRSSEILNLSSAKQPLISVHRDGDAIRNEQALQDDNAFDSPTISAQRDNALNGADWDDAAYDMRAKQDYEKKARELEKEITEARECGLILQAEQKVAELEELTRYVEADTDRRGKPRKLPNEHEKARVAVTNAINRAIERMEEDAPKTATYLKTNIRTGDFATYADISTAWKL
jgi:hypothetical protein